MDTLVPVQMLSRIRRSMSQDRAVSDEQKFSTTEEEKSPRGETSGRVIFFDWDDTLLPSSWLDSKGLRTLNEDVEVPRRVLKKLAAVAEVVAKLLKLAMKEGRVCIVTNGEEGWVEQSAERFVPGLLPLLAQIQVISARTEFERQFPGSPTEWKIQAFTDVLKASFDMEAEDACVISFGDSLHERNALITVTNEMDDIYSKNVKFLERPSADQLRREIDMVIGCFDSICYHNADLDMMLTAQLIAK